MISIYSHSFVRLCFPLLLKIIHGWSIKVVGWSFYSIIIETYNAHDKLLIREENNVLVELQFSHAHIGKLGKIFGNSFAKSSELIHLKVLAKLEGRKKTAASSLARSNGVSWHKEPFDVICKIRGKEARLRNLAFRTVGQAVAGTYWNLPPTQLRAGIGGEGFSSSQNKALPATGVHKSLLPTLLTWCEILKYRIATRCFTSYMNIIITSDKISKYTAHSRGALTQSVVFGLGFSRPRVTC